MTVPSLNHMMVYSSERSLLGVHAERHSDTTVDVSTMTTLVEKVVGLTFDTNRIKKMIMEFAFDPSEPEA